MVGPPTPLSSLGSTTDIIICKNHIESYGKMFPTTKKITLHTEMLLTYICIKYITFPGLAEIVSFHVCLLFGDHDHLWFSTHCAVMTSHNFSYFDICNCINEPRLCYN